MYLWKIKINVPWPKFFAMKAEVTPHRNWKFEHGSCVEWGVLMPHRRQKKMQTEAWRYETKPNGKPGLYLLTKELTRNKVTKKAIILKWATCKRGLRFSNTSKKWERRAMMWESRSYQGKSDKLLHSPLLYNSFTISGWIVTRCSKKTGVSYFWHIKWKVGQQIKKKKKKKVGEEFLLFLYYTAFTRFLTIRSSY